MDTPHGWRKSLIAITQDGFEQYEISPGDSTPQSSSCTATNHPSRKLSKLNEPNMRDIAGEVGTSSWLMYSSGPFHMDEQRQDVQQVSTYSSSVSIRDRSLRIWRKQCTIRRCGERGSGISVLRAWRDDVDDIYIYIYIYIYIFIPMQTVSLYHNCSGFLDMPDALSWDRNQSNFMQDLVSYHSAIRRPTPAREL